MGLWSWAKTAAQNALQGAVNFQEGQSPGSINDSARAVMAEIAKWRDDTSGALETTGAGNVYSLQTNGRVENLASGISVVFKANHTNTGPATLNVDGRGNRKILQAASASISEIGPGTIVVGGFYRVYYDPEENAWVCSNFLGLISDLAANAWKKSDIPLNQVPKHAQSLGDNVDLLSSECGLYYQTSDDRAGTGSNYPEERAGSLLVLKSAGTCLQYQTYNDGTPELYFGSKYNANWSGWKKVWHTGNLNPNDYAHLTEANHFKRSATFETGGHVHDGGRDSGIVIKSFQPSVEHCDMSTSGGSAMSFFDTSNYKILIDSKNDGTIGSSDSTTTKEALVLRGEQKTGHLFGSEILTRANLDLSAFALASDIANDLKVSGQLAFAGGTTWAHGLGAVPRRVGGYLVCVSADGGFSVGTRIQLATADGYGRTIAFTYDDTSVKMVKNGAYWALARDDSSTYHIINWDSPNWKLVLWAEK